jgi:ubiquinone/menaquinone biosynthesis C-methylase UbiE
MKRVLEPEVMDTPLEATDYDAMDLTEVNTDFAKQAIALGPAEKALVLDAGTGPGRIPVLMCQMQPQWQIIAIDLAKSMLQIASQHIQQANLQSRIHLQLVDAKCLPYEDEKFDMVVSNSLVHHLPDPASFFSEIKRVLKPNGAIFLRDLFRPGDEEILNALVESIGKEYNEHQKKLFRNSLQAALTLDEVKQLISQVGLQKVEVYPSSNRHWTAQRPWSC